MSMRRGVRVRRAVGAGLAVIVGAVGVVAPSAGAQVEPDGAVTFTATDGVVKVGDVDDTGLVLPLTCDPDPGLLPEYPGIDVSAFVADECDDPASPPQMVGTVDPAGNLVFGPFTLLDGDPVDVGPEIGLPAGLAFLEMDVEAPAGASGLIQPLAGQVDLDLSLVVEVALTGSLGDHACSLGFDMAMTGPYDMDTGVAVLADNQFTFEMPTDPEVCSPLIQPLGLDMLGDFATPGNNVVRLVFDVDPTLTEHLDPFAPEVGDLAATVPLGGSVDPTIPVSWHPAGECALVGGDGGAEKGTATLDGLVITYTSNGLDAGEDSVTYTCTNDEGSDGGTLFVEVLDNLCTAGLPGAPAGGCSLDQLITFDAVGDVLTMQQQEAAVELEQIILNGVPQSTTGVMNDLTVVNRRGDGAAWSVTGQVTDFTTQDHATPCPADVPSSWDHRCIPGDNLGWGPMAGVDHLAVPGDVAAVAAGSAIDASQIAEGLVAGTGLGSSALTLCSAAEAISGGTFACGADLVLVVPASAAAGTYHATLTLTLA